DSFITTSEFPGTTLNLIEIPLDDKSSIFDTPGIINRHQIAHIINKEDLHIVLPQSELKPVNYQLNDKQSLYFGGLARFDYIKGHKTSLTCHFNKNLKIHRTKLENADELYNRHLTLKPEIDTIKTVKNFKTYQFTLPNYKVDIVISGLGFITIKNEKAVIEIKVPQDVGVFIRDALI
ncbi:MAG: hypothetical protein Q4E81_08845, partial [Succinatimonas sp.]|nr:hypothetical protein [Succinatimonas sp.]